MPQNIVPKRQVIDIANAFAETGELLAPAISSNAELSYPFVVNISFAIELYLKSYLMEDERIPLFDSPDNQIYQGFLKGKNFKHGLEEIYKEIPTQIKSLIELEFKESNLAESFSTLEEALTKYSTSFIKARYPYEKNGFPGGRISDLRDIARFLKATIYKLGLFNASQNYMIVKVVKASSGRGTTLP